MDRAYEGDETRQLALDLGFTPVVPPLKTRRDPWPDVLQRDDGALRLAPALLLRQRSSPGMRRMSPSIICREAFDHVALVLEAAGEQVSEKGAVGITGKRHGHVHRAVSFVPVGWKTWRSGPGWGRRTDGCGRRD